jgi:hypothetical protein
MSSIEERRQDDKFVRKVIGTLVVSLLLQGGGWIYLLGSLMNQVEINTKGLQEANLTRIILAERHYTKLEVHDLVDRATIPIHEKLDDIKKDVSYLVKRGDK